VAALKVEDVHYTYDDYVTWEGDMLIDFDILLSIF